MIERRGNQFVAFCDFCSHEELETEESDFRDAVIDMQKRGWRVFKLNGEWQHKCRDCSTAEFNDELNDMFS